MTYDYFYGQQAEMFTFYRVPKVLFTEECFWNVSTDAKLLYGILLDRMNLSARNNWLDEEGRVYIIFTIEEIKGALGCAEKKAVKLLDELEKKCGLICNTFIAVFLSGALPLNFYFSIWGKSKPLHRCPVSCGYGLRRGV